MPSGSRIGPARALKVATWVVFAFAVCAGFPPVPAVADALPIGARALPGGAHVASVQAAPRLAAALGTGYAHTERIAGSSAVHERVMGDASLAYSPLPSLMLGATGFARFDTHRADGKRQDEGAAFGSAYAARLRHELSPELSVGGELELLFPPANGIQRGLEATSPSARAIGTYAATPDLDLSFNAGVRVDRSRFAVGNPGDLSANDRIGASLSESNAVLLGALASLPFAGFVFTGEWSWELAVGGRAPQALASPMRLEAGVQRALPGQLFAAGRIGVSPSKRPAATDIARIEPRVWIGVTIGMLWGATPPVPAQAKPAKIEKVEPPPAVVEPPKEPAPVSLPPGQIRGRVRSMRGAALAAQIEVVPLAQSHETDAQGAFVIDVPPGHYTVVVRAPGYETQERPAEVEQNGVTILVIDLRRSKR